MQPYCFFFEIVSNSTTTKVILVYVNVTLCSGMCVLLCRIYTLKNLRQVAFELAKWLGARKLEASQGFPAWVSGCPLSSLVMKTTGCVEGLRALVACGQLSGFALFHNLFLTRQKVPGSNPVEGGIHRETCSSHKSG